jgi:hypothetical protein
MKKAVTIAIILAIAAAVGMAAAGSAQAKLTRDERIADAQTLISMFEHRYAPVQWKSDYLGISPDDLTANLISKVYVNDMSTENFYAAMATYSGGVRDTHNWFLIPSLYRANLGFTCDYVEEKIVIADIDRKILPEDVFPFKRGDELLSLGGKSAISIMEELAQYTSEGNEIAEKRFLAINLTNRSQKYYPHIPTGNVIVEIGSFANGEIKSVELKWQTTGKPLETEMIAFSQTTSSHSKISISPSLDIQSPLEKLRWSGIDETKGEGSHMRDPKPFFKLWNTFVERTTEPLYSGIFMLGGRKIGFIRIPTWAPKNRKEWFAFFEREIKYLEENTDALLIDQTDNGGGQICLGEEISRYLVTEPINSNLFQIRANNYFLEAMEKWYQELKEMGSETGDTPIIEAILDEIRTAIRKGQRLTEPVSICFNDGKVKPFVNAHDERIVYSKPILMLINEWSISTADMTPAFLQDSGRVKMFGARTCGAGGSVTTSSNIGYSDFKISQTESLAVRPRPVVTENGFSTRYLENVGVIPDFPYEITLDDFMGGYLGYRNAVDNALSLMLDGKDGE